MKTHILSFEPDGSARTLWTDALPLNTLGSIKVERASSIEFNNQTNEWEVRMAVPCSESGCFGPVEFSHASRQACINWEIAHVNKTL